MLFGNSLLRSKFTHAEINISDKTIKSNFLLYIAFRSLLELLRNKSRYIQLSAFMCACLTLPSEKLDRLQHDLPNTFDHCKQRGLWNVLKSSKPLYCNPNPKILTVDVSSCTVGREGGYSQNFTQHVAKEVLGSMIR